MIAKFDNFKYQRYNDVYTINLPPSPTWAELRQAERKKKKKKKSSSSSSKPKRTSKPSTTNYTPAQPTKRITVPELDTSSMMKLPTLSETVRNNMNAPFERSWWKAYTDYTYSPEALTERYGEPQQRIKRMPLPGGGMKTTIYQAWIDEDGNEVKIDGPTPEEQHAQYLAEHPAKDASETLENYLLFGALTGGAGAALGGFSGALGNTARTLIGDMALGEAVHQTGNLIYGGDYMQDAFNYIGGNNISNPLWRDIAFFGFGLADPSYWMGGWANNALSKSFASMRGYAPNWYHPKLNWMQRTYYNTKDWANNNFGYEPGKGFQIGNNYYKVDPSTMSMGLPYVKKTPKYAPNPLPGYQTKSFAVGSQLEKQVSPKDGTIAVEQLQTYIRGNNVPTHEKYLIQQVLDKHAGETRLDYNTLRKEIQEMIPTYEMVPQDKYYTYGTKGLGLSEEASPSKAADILFVRRTEGNELVSRRRRWPGDMEGGEIVPGSQVREEALAYMQQHPEQFYQFNTFTFESPGIKGNTKHFPGDPIGHARTYTSADEPGILFVMENQSDWAQSGGLTTNIRKHRLEQALNFAKRDLEAGKYGFGTKEELEQKITDLTKQIEEMSLTPVHKRMVNTYTQRQIHELLSHAAKNEYTKMRLPTRESAVKIQGYEAAKVPETLSDGALKSINYDPNLATPYTEKIYQMSEQLKNTTDVKEIQKLKSELKRAQKIEQRWKNGETTYALDQETVLNHYSNFPNEYGKIFKGAEVRTVKDSKGNTWYEVDVPQNYLDGSAEIVFRKGGRLKLLPKIKKWF